MQMIINNIAPMEQHTYWFIVYNGPFAMDGLGCFQTVTKSAVVDMDTRWPNASRLKKALVQNTGHNPKSITITLLEEWSKERYDAWIAQ